MVAEEMELMEMQVVVQETFMVAAVVEQQVMQTEPKQVAQVPQELLLLLNL